MFLIKAKQIKKRKSTVCCDCGREIARNEYATELAHYDAHAKSIRTSYTCCHPPHHFNVTDGSTAFADHDAEWLTPYLNAEEEDEVPF